MLSTALASLCIRRAVQQRIDVISKFPSVGADIQAHTWRGEQLFAEYFRRPPCDMRPLTTR